MEEWTPTEISAPRNSSSGAPLNNRHRRGGGQTNGARHLAAPWSSTASILRFGDGGGVIVLTCSFAGVDTASSGMSPFARSAGSFPASGPSEMRRAASAPPFNSRETHAAWPALAASCKGVTPSSLPALASAPASSKAAKAVSWPKDAAQCRGESPPNVAASDRRGTGPSNLRSFVTLPASPNATCCMSSACAAALQAEPSSSHATGVDAWGMAPTRSNARTASTLLLLQAFSRSDASSSFRAAPSASARSSPGASFSFSAAAADATMSARPYSAAAKRTRYSSGGPSS
mmetsp:Transcript_21868/g.57086  ORF Transcript_21868/g.57086 Transcript_21868/m.57086 type:complete len:289 (+) Transcript_21868:1107-1973(+)